MTPACLQCSRPNHEWRLGPKCARCVLTRDEHPFLPPAPPNLTCDECGDTKATIDFCDPSASEPHCKTCAAGFWEMMGDDPCGKGWQS